jgi:hypothetical protein
MCPDYLDRVTDYISDTILVDSRLILFLKLSKSQISITSAINLFPDAIETTNI